MVLVLIYYLRPAPEVEKARPAHRAFLDTCVRSGHLVVAGPRADHEGGILLARGRSLDEVKHVFAADPFQTGGIARYEFLEFKPSRQAPGFEAFADPI